MNEHKKIKGGQILSEKQFIKTRLDRINSTDTKQDEDRGVKLDKTGFISDDIGGCTTPINIEQIDANTQRQYFIDGTYKEVVKVSDSEIKVYDQNGNLENTITNQNGNITQTVTD